MAKNSKSTAHSRALNRLLVISLLFIVLTAAAIVTPVLINKLDVQLLLAPLNQIVASVLYTFPEPFNLTTVVVGVTVTLLYLAAIILVFGLIGACIGKIKGRVAGAFALAFDLAGLALGSHYFYEFFKGAAAGTIAPYWSWITLGLTGVVALLFIIVLMNLFGGGRPEVIEVAAAAEEPKEEAKVTINID
jgi:hypothetical protein